MFSDLLQSKKRITEGYAKLKSPQTRQFWEKSVSKLENMHVLKRDRTRYPEE